MDNIGQIILYILGYSEIEQLTMEQHILFAILGIIIVGLFSSYITLVFIERKSKLVIKDRIEILDEDPKKAKIGIKTKHWDLFDIHVVLMVNYNDRFYTAESFIPYMKRYMKKELIFGTEVGSVIFWHLRAETVPSEAKDTEMVLKIDFINGKNSQSYSAVKKYTVKQKRNIRCAVLEAMKEKAGQHEFPINLSGAKTFCAESDGCKASILDLKEQQVTWTYDLPAKAPNDSYAMICIKNPMGGDWQPYYDMNCCLKFNVWYTFDIDFQVEVKDRHNKNLFADLGKTGKVVSEGEGETCQEGTIRFCSMDRDTFSEIAELCFTVKHHGEQRQSGRLTIDNCRMVVDNKKNEF